jgi:hypothetical protein
LQFAHAITLSFLQRSGAFQSLWLCKLARVLVRFDQVARIIVNADHSAM